MGQYPPCVGTRAIMGYAYAVPRLRGTPRSLRRAALPRQPGIGDVVRIEPRRARPAVFVVFRHALLGELRHVCKRTRRARIPKRLNTDILVITGIIALVEFMASAEFGADRIPQQLHHLDALLVVDAI